MYKIVAFILLLSFSVRAQQPELKGGLANFIKSNTVYPGYSLQNCIQGNVDVGFKLNAKGDVYYSTIVNGIGTDLDDEALRLVRISSGKWIVPLAHDTLTMLIVPINFTLSGFDCDRKNKDEIALAIKAYKDGEELEKVVLNFYQNKENGKYRPEDEAKILRIKNELEITDEYLEQRIKSGIKKIKQGDKQGACEDFNFVKYMGSEKANEWLIKYCK